MIYTDNYQLRKPVIGVDNADVGDLNYNSDRIDAIMHASQVSLADAYDQTATYNTGDKVMYEFLMYKCKEDNVTGNWDATKWERTTAAETGGGEVDFDLFGEVSGNPASFADGSESALVECEVEFEPKQDLHGYDKPWAPGTGKNKLNVTATSTTESGVTITINSDGTIETTNTATATILLSLGSISTEGTYKIYGCPSGGSSATYELRASNTNGNFVQDFGSGSNNITVGSGETLTAYLIIRSGFNATGLTFKPMILLSTETATTFEPYSNICPISGHSSVTINVSPTSDPSQGVDTTIQLGGTYYSGTLNVGKGELTVTHRVITENDFISVSSGTSGGGLHYANCDLSEPEATSANAISNMLVQNQSGWGSTTPCFTTNTGTAPNIYLVRIYCSESTLADFKAAYSGLQICYELATPITVQIPPTTINTLLGQNYISSEDTGDIDIVYVKASAPIQPNPTGQPTATLKKLGIEGTVFELEGGGGGSSAIDYSTTEQKTGRKWIDGKDIYERTYTGTFSVPSGGAWYNTGIALSDVENLIDTQCRQSIAKWNFISGLNNSGTLVLVNPTSGSLSVENITIQYTKITD